MTVTADTIVVNVDPFDIPVASFRSIQVARKSPAAGEADTGYSAIAAARVSIAFGLAVFNHESQMATDPNAIVVKYDTRNPGNCRSLRPDSGAHGTVIDTPRGEFVQYQTWTDGWRDFAYRLVDPHYVYVKEGRRTIRQIIERFAPSNDSNDPDSYVNAVVRDMNRWIEAQPMAGDDSRFTWAPDTQEFGYPTKTHGRNGKQIDYLIIHVTEGTDSAAWLRGEHGSSTHYLTNRDATPREQHVAEADAAWTPGNQDYAERSINIEFERFTKDAWTRGEINDAIATVAPIMKRHGIPAVYLARDSAGKRGIIGHQDVPDGHGGWGGSSHHGDPGPKFPWDTFIAGLKVALGEGGGQPPADDGNPWYLNLGNGQTAQYAFRRGFRGVVEGLAQCRYPNDPNSAALALVGPPAEDEWTGVDGHAYQLCQRVLLHYIPGNGQPWDVIFEPVNATVPAKKVV